MMQNRPSVPVTTIGGYLGSGKTTLVNHLLRNANGRKLAVLVNEFGDLPIDEDLIEAQDETLISIAGGCICCSFGNDLIGALRDMLGGSTVPDQILIETSGVAIPSAIVATVALLTGLHSDASLVVVDAETVRTAARDDYIGDTITRQLSDADIVVVNKGDLVSDTAKQELADWLSDVAPGSVILPTEFGRVAPDAIFGCVAEPSHGLTAHHSDALFESITLHPDPIEDVPNYVHCLITENRGIVRAKGYVYDMMDQCWLIQVVGQRSNVTRSDQAKQNGLVCIGLRGRCDFSGLRP